VIHDLRSIQPFVLDPADGRNVEVFGLRTRKCDGARQEENDNPALHPRSVPQRPCGRLDMELREFDVSSAFRRK
jgi:hypothetical protein